MDTGHERYARAAWKRFHDQPDRTHATLQATQDLHVRRVLDVGCGAGQELFPFVSQSALGVGIDYVNETGQLARKLYDAELPQGRVAFARATGDALPFSSEVFDVLICRLALPYMDNSRALSEFARVLRPGGCSS